MSQGTMRYGERNSVIFEGVRIVFRNFAGEEGKYNKEGDRNFALVLTPDMADELTGGGWNVKRKPPKEEGDDEFCFLPVTVSFKGRPPRLVLVSSKGRTTLDQGTADLLDNAEMHNIDVIIRPYDWKIVDNRGSMSGRKAYLQSIYVTLFEDELEQKYADVKEIGYEEPSDLEIEEFEG